MNKKTYLLNENIKYSINTTTKNTYILLALTILFSSLTTFLGMIVNSKINTFLYLILSFLLLFLINKNKHNILGIPFVFLFTGFIGYFSNPLIKNLMYNQNGQKLIIFSLLITSILFVILSILISLKKYKINFLNNLISTGFITLVLLILTGIFIKLSIIQLIISSITIILSSLIIMNTTNNIINDNNYNYIDATIELYLSIYNIFTSIITFIMIFNKDD